MERGRGFSIGFPSNRGYKANKEWGKANRAKGAFLISDGANKGTSTLENAGTSFSRVEQGNSSGYNIQMSTKHEKTAMSLFQYGYEDSVIAARAELSVREVKELRIVYDLFKEKKE